MGWRDAPIVQAAAAGDTSPAWANAPTVANSPKEGDPVPAGGAPEGFYAVTEDDGKKTLRREVGPADIIRWLGDIPGVGAAERLGQGAVNLGGKALSGLTGIVSGGDPDIVRRVQQATHVDLPPSNDPLVQGAEAAQRGAQVVAAPIDKVIGNLPAGPRTAIEAAEEAAPDVAALAGVRGALPEQAASLAIARSPAEVAKAAGYTGLRTRADLHAPGNQAITDTLISRDAGMVPGQTPSIAALENAAKVGPGQVYRQAEASLPPQMSMRGDALEGQLQNLPNQVSQLPRSPDVAALQETMLAQPEFSRDELFANIREARERAKAHWKSDDPDKGVLGDAYHALANAYEDFAGRQLEAAGSPVSLADWQAARTQMAKNYQARGALRGEHFDPSVYGKIAERNPHLLTDNAAIVGHVANGLPASSLVGMADIGPAAGGALAGEALGQHMGVPGVGAMTGAIAAPLIRAKLENLITRGRPAVAAQTGTNPALSYYFDQGRLPPGWNRAPSSPLPSPFGGYLPAPSMVNAGGGASTASTLESLGLTPDVQAAGAQHPAAARLQALREQLSRPPMEQLEFQGPQSWGPPGLETKPPSSETTSPLGETIPFADVLEQGGNQARPVGGVSKVPPRLAPQSPKGPNMRTPSGPPETTEAPISAGPSPAQAAFRNRLAADRLRKLAGDLRMEGPGGAEGDPIERLRAALERRERGYAAGGEVLNFAKRGAATLMERIENAFHNPYTADAAQLRQDIAKYWRTAAPTAQAAEHPPPALLAAPREPSLDDLTRELQVLSARASGQPDAMLLQPGFLTKPQAFANGGEVSDSSIRDVAEVARALNSHSTPQAAQDRARIATNLASLFYGLDDKGNPAFGGRAWTSSQGGTPMGLLDALTATPHEGVQTLATLASLADQGRQKLGLPGKSIPASFWDSIDPSWSQAAAARLAQLKARVQNASGLPPSQSLEDKVLDAVTDPTLVAPLGAARFAREAPLLRSALNWSAGGTETPPQQVGAQ